MKQKFNLDTAKQFMKKHWPWFVAAKLVKIIVVLALASSFSCTKNGTKKTFINIGTGGVTGVYYPTGAAICKTLNKQNPNIKCTVEATAASVYNVNGILAGKLDLGIVQSDVAYKALNGIEPFKAKHTELKSVMSIHSESLTLVARKDSNIKSLMDLKGKKVNIGNPGSGTRRTVKTLFEACNIPTKSLAFAAELKAAEMPDALRDKKLDAYFYVVGHPTANIKDIATGTDIEIISLDLPCTQKLTQANSYFVPTKIPGGLYKGVDKDVASFGFKAVLLTSKRLKDSIATDIVTSVKNNFDFFKTLHPSYSNLTPKSISTGLSVPLHDALLNDAQDK